MMDFTLNEERAKLSRIISLFRHKLWAIGRRERSEGFEHLVNTVTWFSVSFSNCTVSAQEAVEAHFG